MSNILFSHSQLAAVSVKDILKCHYNLPQIASCKFYARGLHDNYLIECEGSKYIFRVYRNDWRAYEEIQFELEFLDFMRGKTDLVAAPILTKSSELSFTIECPEGLRSATLFPYADGVAPGVDITPAQSRVLGKTIAEFHQISRPFKTKHTRHILDLPHLLDDSIRAIQPFVDAAAEHYLHELSKKLEKALSPMTINAQDYGICQGDVNLQNFHIDTASNITLFDFDQCGLGYRAFEIGKFFSSLVAVKNKNEIATAFLDGYQQKRTLSNVELESVPYYELVAVIWVMAIHTLNPNLIGHKRLEKPYWDRQINILKSLGQNAF